MNKVFCINVPRKKKESTLPQPPTLDKSNTNLNKSNQFFIHSNKINKYPSVKYKSNSKVKTFHTRFSRPKISLVLSLMSYNRKDAALSVMVYT